jgi:hypothetical protein
MLTLPLLLLLAADPPVPATAATNQVPSPVFATSGHTRPAETEKGCVGRSIRLPRALAGMTGSVTAKFAVDRDGSVSRFELLSEAPGEVASGLWQAVQDCRFSPGKDPRGMPVLMWVILPIRFQGDAPPPEAGTTPREADPGCIQKQLHFRLPPNRLLHGLLVVRVALSAEGTPGAIELHSDLPDDVANAVRLSIRGCSFLPARSAIGQALAGTFEYRVNFALPGEAERASVAPKLKREARLASTTCLQRLRAFGVIGHAVVQVRVTADGEPTDFRLQPENVPADLRLHIFDVLSTCKWEPALGLDDLPVAADAVVTIRYR